ncbi:hypothetical protein BOX15_Mlig025661g1, partial [Macrostomum lignano]
SVQQLEQASEVRTRLYDKLCTLQNTTGCSSAPDNACLEGMPMSSVDDVLAFCVKLEDAEFHECLVRRLVMIGGKSVKDTVRLMIGRLMTNELQGIYNRNGTDGRHKFIGPMDSLVQAAARRAHPTEVETDVIDAIAKTLKNSRDRDGGREDRRRREPEQLERQGGQPRSRCRKRRSDNSLT